MKSHQRLTLSVVGLVTLCGAGASMASTLYDSNGFDSTTRFSSSYVSPAEPLVGGNLRDQDFVRQWVYSGTNTTSTTTGKAQVVTSGTNPVLSGTQSIKLTRTSADNHWAPANINYNTSINTDKVVLVTWDMN